MRRLLLLVCLLAGGTTPAQDTPAGDEVLPKPTKEGIAALQELMKRCVEGAR